MAKQTFTTGQVLTAAQMTSLQQTAMLGGDTTAKTASYVLVAADAGTTVAMNAAGATTITVNTGLFAAGDTVFIQNRGAGVCTITAGTATVTTASSLALAQYEGGTLYLTSTSAAIFFKSDGAAAAGGGMTLLDTLSLSGSSVTSTTFSSSYKQIIVYVKKAHASGQTGFNMRMNANTGNQYSWQYVQSGTSATFDSANNASYFRIGTASQATSASRKTYSITTITRPSDSDVVFVDVSEIWGAGASDMYQGSATGNFSNDTDPITSITLFISAGTFSGGEAFIYGVN